MIKGAINLGDRLHGSGDDRGVNKGTCGMINRICSVWKTKRKLEKKKNKDSETPGNITKDSTFISSES